MSNCQQRRSVQTTAMSIVISAFAAAGCGGANDVPTNAEAEAPLRADELQRPAPNAAREGSPAKAEVVRTGRWRGMKVDYAVKNGKAIAGGDMVLGPVDGNGNLTVPDFRLGKRIEKPRPRSIASSKSAGKDEPPSLMSKDEPQSLIGNGNIPGQEGWLWWWPQRDFGPYGLGGCQVYYDIDFTIYDDGLELEAVNQAVAWFNSNTYCRWDQTTPGDGNQHVTFIHRDADDHVGLASNIGRNCWMDASGSPVCFNQEIFMDCRSPDGLLGRDCVSVAKHEMFHTLGFMHEHQREERNWFVDVQPGADTNNTAYTIIPYSDSVWSWGENAYDINSIMHYYTTCQFIPGGVFFGAWVCTGSALRPKGIVPGEFVWTPNPDNWRRSVGGNEVSGRDMVALRTMYPNPILPPGPPPPCGPTVCQHAPDSPCCNQ